MVYEWGKKLEITSEEVVDRSYTYQKGQYGIVRDVTLETSRTINPSWLPSEKQIADKLIEKFASKGATVLYLKIESYYYTTGGYIDHYYKRFKLVECLFQGSPFTGLEWLAIIAGITVAGILIGLLATGIWLVVTVMEEAKKLGPLATIGIGLILIVIIFVVILLILGVKFEKKGKRIKVGK